MKTVSFVREAALGVFVALMIIPPLPAQAQWTVFDPAAYTQRVNSELKRVQEWVQKVQQYQQMYLNAVNQYTTMRGVLQTVDRQLAKNMQFARLTNDIGEIIRGSYRIKNQVEAMTRRQIASLQQIDDRLKNGIFNPELDLQDFEDYLVYSMGRNSKQTIQLMTRAVKADVLMQNWLIEKQRLSEELAIVNDRLNALKEQLNAERDNPDPAVTQPLNEAIHQLESQAQSLEKRIAELEEKYQQRMNAYGLRLSDMENFGYTILSTNEAWRELQTTKDEIAETFDGLILGMTP
jgi:chromosome segregation ATPase